MNNNRGFSRRSGEFFWKLVPAGCFVAVAGWEWLVRPPGKAVVRTWRPLRKAVVRAERKAMKRPGYLLIAVLVMIAIASLILSRVAQMSMRVASVAVAEEREMRNRWAVTSLRRYALDAAPALLGTQSIAGASGGETPGTTFWRDVDMAGQTWRIIVADESSKVNLHRLMARYDEQVVSPMINELIAGGRNVRAGRSVGKQAGGRWERWLEGISSKPLRSPRTIAAATQRMTLWGDGRLNLRGCDGEALDLLWRQLFGRSAPSVVHELRDQSVPPPMDQVIAGLGIRESQAEIVRAWFSTESRCRSVWVFCQTDRRIPASFFVEWGQLGGVMEHRGYEY